MTDDRWDSALAAKAAAAAIMEYRTMLRDEFDALATEVGVEAAAQGLRCIYPAADKRVLTSDEYIAETRWQAAQDWLASIDG